jgi:hypothetical protein
MMMMMMMLQLQIVSGQMQRIVASLPRIHVKLARGTRKCCTATSPYRAMLIFINVKILLLLIFWQDGMLHDDRKLMLCAVAFRGTAF